MNYTIIKPLPPIEAIMQAYPLSDIAKAQIQQDRSEIKAILDGRDSRLLVIIGPCSAWPDKAVLAYAARLAAINQQVKHALKLVMRVYIQKPRTTKGWIGPVNQPDIFAPPNIAAGMAYSRAMMINVINMGLPIADEALYTHQGKGFLELLSWVAVGARSTENQAHRVFASALDCAVGLKNPTHGALNIAVNSIIAAQHPHVAAFDGHEVQTHGNPYAHLVLRGSNSAPNYSIAHLEEVQHYMQMHAIQNPSVIIDASHDNCLVHGKKNHNLQYDTVFNTIENLKGRPDLRPLVKGFMVESFLKAGRQTVEPTNPDAIDLDGLSITDPCLGWEQTERLLCALAVKSFIIRPNG